VSAVLRTELRSPVRVELADLIGLKPAGETIRLSTPRVRAMTIGGHLSPFKGRGVEFDESRPYQAGDDLRTIDWRVTARTGKPHTKVFREERNRPVFLWLDLRAPMMFATKGVFKSVAAAEAAALIAWSAVHNGDQLGGLVFSDNEHDELRPRLGRRAALRLLQLVASSPAWYDDAGGEIGATTASAHALLRLTRVARPGSMLFLLSDFTYVDDESERHVRQLAARSDVFLVHLFDPLEAELPPPGRYRIQVGQRTFTIDAADIGMRERHRRAFEAHCERLAGLAKIPGVSLLRCATNEDPYQVLLQRFARA
jgi:uncharacterized protein (DUF58 family)